METKERYFFDHSGELLDETMPLRDTDITDRLNEQDDDITRYRARIAALEAENAKLRAALERADDMANALVVYFNKRGVNHSMRKGNEDIGALADALSNYGPLRLAEMDARQRDIVQGITERRAALASEKGA